MKLTKHAHACVTLEKDGTRLVIDPGTLTPDAAEAVAGADAVLITHEHFDHFDEQLVAAALQDRPGLHVYGTAAVAAALGSHDGRVHAVAAGDTFDVGSVTVSVHGHRHALIHPDIPCPDNVGYLVDEGTVHHPGDAYYVPDAPVRTLLLPISGPWTKFGRPPTTSARSSPSVSSRSTNSCSATSAGGPPPSLLGEKGLTGIPIEYVEPGADVQV